LEQLKKEFDELKDKFTKSEQKNSDQDKEILYLKIEVSKMKQKEMGHSIPDNNEPLGEPDEANFEMESNNVMYETNEERDGKEIDQKRSSRLSRAEKSQPQTYIYYLFYAIIHLCIRVCLCIKFYMNSRFYFVFQSE